MLPTLHTGRAPSSVHTFPHSPTLSAPTLGAVGDRQVHVELRGCQGVVREGVGGAQALRNRQTAHDGDLLRVEQRVAATVPGVLGVLRYRGWGRGELVRSWSSASSVGQQVAAAVPGVLGALGVGGGG